MNSNRRRPLLVVALTLVAVLSLPAQSPAGGEPIHATAIPQDHLMEPEQLHRALAGPSAPLVLQVGSRFLFDQAHIPGSEYAGPGSRPEGLAWQLLHSMGFTNVRALHLADNFGADWVARGYRAASSH